MILHRDSFGIWSLIAKRAFKAVFRKPRQREAWHEIHESLSERKIAVYLHIPFCKGICTFCPYVRYPLRSNRLLREYLGALEREISLYGKLLSDLDLKVTDIHVGGGTPSLLEGKDFKKLLGALNEHFDSPDTIAIEANPEDLQRKEKVSRLVEAGVREVSLGVQSFSDGGLRKLGRRHDSSDSVRAIENLRDAGLDYLNLDLMYMLPGQELEEWTRDLERAAESGADEITCYPTLVAEHCTAYKLAKAGKLELRQPGMRTFKQMVYAAERVLPSHGYEPVEIYGYSRKDGWKYATVNYELEGPLLGFGCGACGFTGGYEYQNTCSVEEYIRVLGKDELPVAGGRAVGLAERAVRYAVCRLFVCRELDLHGFKRKLGEDFEKAVGKGFSIALHLLETLGHIGRKGRKLTLTRRGFFTAHLACWSFVLNVPCRMSEEFLKAPWPTEVRIP